MGGTETQEAMEIEGAQKVTRGGGEGTARYGACFEIRRHGEKLKALKDVGTWSERGALEMERHNMKWRSMVRNQGV